MLGMPALHTFALACTRIQDFKNDLAKPSWSQHARVLVRVHRARVRAASRVPPATCSPPQDGHRRAPAIHAGRHFPTSYLFRADAGSGREARTARDPIVAVRT